ncbi:MAG: hypothetical protein ACXVAB_07075 [Thermodesulfobacteriota bacterium]
MLTLKRSIFLLLIVLSFAVCISLSTAETNPVVPSQYGDVIYRINEESPNQIFIIGLSHRDSLTCLNGDLTSRVQSEVFKIGDWLIHDQELGLLLPEGFFKSASTKTQRNPISVAQRDSNCASYDIKALEKRLSDNKVYVNAEMLLKETHPIRLGQVEDKPLYDAVRANILKLVSSQGPACDYAVTNSELEYLQERRTAAMLQKIPEIVNDEFQQGNIKNRKAIFTVGLYHIHEIVQFLNENKIKIHAPKPASVGIKDYTAELNLQKENFGITIILPRILTKDQKILEINKLTEIVNRSRGIQTSKVSSLPSLQP